MSKTIISFFIVIFIASLITGCLAKYAYNYPRGYFLWDLSLLMLGASIFGAAGYIIGWNIHSK